jgi:hypothetical protein
MPCDFMLNPPQVRRVSALATHWSNAALSERRDLAFRIAVEPIEEAPAFSVAAEPPCPADMDLDGSYGVPDIFVFLSAWFSGCP